MLKLLSGRIYCLESSNGYYMPNIPIYFCRYDPEGGKCIDGGCCPSDNFVVTTKSK